MHFTRLDISSIDLVPIERSHFFYYRPQILPSNSLYFGRYYKKSDFTIESTAIDHDLSSVLVTSSGSCKLFFS